MGVQLDVKHDYMQHEITEIPEQQNIKVKDWNMNNLYEYDKLKKDPNPLN